MSEVYWQWIEARFAVIRAVFLYAAMVLAFLGLVSSFMGNDGLSVGLWAAAYLCKCVECWLLEKALVESQVS